MSIDAGSRRPDFVLFSEAPTRWVVSYKPGDAAKVHEIARKHGVPLQKIGSVGGTRVAMTVGAASVDLPLADVVAANRDGFRKVAD